ncbi:unnamed protein product [Mytilus coruscus]|uniref:Uncharacterized protein n=1 Tax=Mytilus coruscus TaxID=42192 RepID=A0A6J8DPZ9_MYTCO|nr:unnamed protein product [Mytilus coruscus]
MNFKNAEGQLARWLEVLSSYNMKIKHRPGNQHRNADALSRMPCKQCDFDKDWEKKLVRVNVVTQAPPIEANEAVICINDGSDENKTLLVLQQEDENISLVKTWVFNGKKPLFKEIGERNYAVKSLWSQYETLKVDNGLMCKEQSTGAKLRVIVPMKERRAVLQQCHDNKTSGHLGIRKTLGRLKDRFYWPGMRSDVVAYITGCETCARRKGPQKRKRAPMQIQRSGFPMERIAIDILGELPKTANDNKYILHSEPYDDGKRSSYSVDIMYELPREVKSIPANKWVWELQERMEDAHQFVQTHVNREMRRQKQYHDKHLSWNTFNKNDKVFVFFPVRKLGQSPKFTSYWRGPFKVLKQYSDVTYLVNCGRKGRPQVIHVDRMRQCKDQRLLGEPLLGERLQGLEPSNQVSEMNDQAQVVGESA